MKAQPLIVYLPDRRDVQVSTRWTMGNNKIGPNVYTYSRISGYPADDRLNGVAGTCPGATTECEAICYATRIAGEVRDRVYTANAGHDVPPIPADAKIVRAHVSGDFDTPEYILSWVERLKERPDVTFWAYTRSWRCHSLHEHLDQLRALPNVELFASMDASNPEMPPDGWRRAWIWRDKAYTTRDDGPTQTFGVETRLMPRNAANTVQSVVDGKQSLTCPEERGTQPNCEACRFCLDAAPNSRLTDVTFLEH